MSLLARDTGAIKALASHFRKIAGILDAWVGAQPAVEEAGHALPPYNLDEVAEHFSNIVDELNKGGLRGADIYKHFPAIAQNLRAAADALAPHSNRKGE